MPKPVIKKWWVGMVQGIMLIILSIYIFNNPLNAMKGLSIWIGLLILFTGLVGIFSWMAADRDKRNTSLLWSLLTIVFGIVMLMNLFTTTRIVEILFGLWMVFLGLHFIEQGIVFMKHQTLSMGNCYCRGLCLLCGCCVDL
jgi:uncharacterized membrane protein HdeD (DUF308 family)